jgi:membrane-associated phospholipid phosphatase
MQLVPGSLRRAAVALLAVCVAVLVAAGVRVSGYGLPGWLDATFDPRFEAQQGRFPVLLDWLPHLGELKAVTVLTFALVLACAIIRRWRGAVLTALAVPIAIGITDYVLKPTVGEAIGAAFPSGHATSSFALAASFAVLLANPPLRVPAGLRLLLVLLAVLMATAVAAAMVAIGAHTFSDAVGGAAVGVGVVLAGALILDALGSLLRPEPAAPPPPAVRSAAERPVGSQVRPLPPTRS